MTDLSGGGYTSDKTMDTTLGPISARRASIGAADDPFKKYWWVILVGFALTGTWIVEPALEGRIGSGHVGAATKPGLDPSSAEQSLDSAENPSGAPGGALDLSMDGLKHKSRSDEETASMLYQAASDGGAVAAGAPLGAAPGALAPGASGAGSLAQELKDAGKPKDEGGWGEKAQSGFSAAHGASRLNGGAGLSGLGSTSSGGSSASMGGAGAFGLKNAQAGFADAVGLHDKDVTGPAVSALRRSAAAGSGSGGLNAGGDGQRAGVGAVFDGSKGKGNGIGGSGSNAMASAKAAYDSAPANLKLNDPNLDYKKMTDPPVAPTPESTNQNIGQEIAMMAATTLVGGMIGGVGGQMVMMLGMMLMQEQQQQAAAKAAQQQQSTVKQRYGLQ